ncbi:hypothetical protein V2G26_018928 [Clonostachys chloroleuca]
MLMLNLYAEHVIRTWTLTSRLGTDDISCTGIDTRIDASLHPTIFMPLFVFGTSLASHTNSHVLVSS